MTTEIKRHNYDGKMWESPPFSDESAVAAIYEIAIAKTSPASVHDEFLRLDSYIRVNCRNIPEGYRLYYGVKTLDKASPLKRWTYNFIYINW